MDSGLGWDDEIGGRRCFDRRNILKLGHFTTFRDIWDFSVRPVLGWVGGPLWGSLGGSWDGGVRIFQSWDISGLSGTFFLVETPVGRFVCGGSGPLVLRLLLIMVASPHRSWQGASVTGVPVRFLGKAAEGMKGVEGVGCCRRYGASKKGKGNDVG